MTRSFLRFALAFAAMVYVPASFADNPVVSTPDAAPFTNVAVPTSGSVTPDQTKVSICKNCPADAIDLQRALGRNEVDPSTAGGKVEQGVNLFTGQAVTPIPVETIGSAFGLGFPITLAYSTPPLEAFSSSGRLAPSGYVGYGWSLQFPAVLLNHKGTASTADDVYTGDFGPLGGGQILPGDEMPIAAIDGATLRAEWRVVGNPGLKVYSYRSTTSPTPLWWQVDAPGGMSMVLGKKNRRFLTLVGSSFEIPLDAGKTDGTVTTNMPCRWDVDEIYNREVRAKFPANDKSLTFTFRYITDAQSFQYTTSSGVVLSGVASWTKSALPAKITVNSGTTELEAVSFILAAKSVWELDEGSPSASQPKQQKQLDNVYVNGLNHSGIGGSRSYSFGYSVLKGNSVFNSTTCDASPVESGAWNTCYSNLGGYRHEKRLLTSIRLQSGAQTRQTNLTWRKMTEDPISPTTGFQPYFLESITEPSGKVTTWKYQRQTIPSSLAKRAVQDPYESNGVVLYKDLASATDYTDQSYISDRFSFVVLKKPDADLHVEVYRGSGRGLGAQVYQFHSNATNSSLIKKATDNWKFIGGKDWFAIYSEPLQKVQVFSWDGSAFKQVMDGSATKVFPSGENGIVLSKESIQDVSTSVTCPASGQYVTVDRSVRCSAGKALRKVQTSTQSRFQKDQKGDWISTPFSLPGRILEWYSAAGVDVYKYCIENTVEFRYYNTTGGHTSQERWNCASGDWVAKSGLDHVQYASETAYGSAGWGILRSQPNTNEILSESPNVPTYKLAGRGKNYLVFSYNPDVNYTQCQRAEYNQTVLPGEWDQLYDIYWLGSAANGNSLIKTIQASGVDNTVDDFTGDFESQPPGGPLWWEPETWPYASQCIQGNSVGDLGCVSAECKQRRRRRFQVPLGIAAADNYFVYSYGWTAGVYWAGNSGYPYGMPVGFGVVSFTNNGTSVAVRNQRRVLGKIQDKGGNNGYQEWGGIRVGAGVLPAITPTPAGFFAQLQSTGSVAGKIEYGSVNVPYSDSKWNSTIPGPDCLSRRAQAFYPIASNGDISYQDYNLITGVNDLFPAYKFVDGKVIAAATGPYYFDNGAGSRINYVGGYTAADIAVLPAMINSSVFNVQTDVTKVNWVRFDPIDDASFKNLNSYYTNGQSWKNTTSLHFNSDKSGIGIVRWSSNSTYYIRPFIVSPNRTGSTDVNNWVVSEVITSIGDPVAAPSSDVVRYQFSYPSAVSDAGSGLSYNSLTNSLQSERTLVNRVDKVGAVLGTSEVRFRTLGLNQSLTADQMSLIGTDTLTRSFSGSIAGKEDSARAWLRSVPANEPVFSSRNLWVNRVDSTKNVSCFRANNCLASVRKFYGYDLLSGVPGWVVDSSAGVPRKISQSIFTNGKVVQGYSWLLPTVATGAALAAVPSSTPLTSVAGLNSAVPTGASYVQYCAGNEWLPCNSWQWRPAETRTDAQLKTGVPLSASPVGDPTTTPSWEKVSEITDLRGTDIYESGTRRVGGTSTSSKDVVYTSTFYEGVANLPVAQISGASRSNSAVLMAEDGAQWTSRTGWEACQGCTIASTISHTGAYSIKVQGSWGPTKNVYPKDLNVMKAGYMVSAWIYVPSTVQVPSAGIQIYSASATDPLNQTTWTYLNKTKSSRIQGGQAFKANTWQLHQVHFSYDELVAAGVFSLDASRAFFLRFWAGFGDMGTTMPVAYVDDIVGLPDNATYDLSAYDPTNGWVTGKVNNAGRTTYYDRDPRGTVIAVRDEFGRSFNQSASHMPGENDIPAPVGGFKQGFVALKNINGLYQVQNLTVPPSVFVPGAKWVSGNYTADGKKAGARISADNGQYLIDVFRVKNGVLATERWSTGDLQVSDGVATDWVAGDFTGDGLWDLLCLRDDGTGTRDVYLMRSTGSGFEGPFNYGKVPAGGQFLAGNFDGAGTFDLARVLNDAGNATIQVMLGTGKGLAVPAIWALQQGGYWDDQRWMAADLNSDGKWDLAKAFADGTNASIDIHLWSGSAFSISRLATQQGGYWTAMEWFVDAINSDGNLDFGKFWADGSGLSLDAHISNGVTASINRKLTQQGSIQGTGQWFFADVDGNGFNDIILSVQK